jgi:hypothetical protein
LGEKHPNTLKAMHDLAIIWYSQNRHDDAMNLMDECLQLSRPILGPDHALTKEPGKVFDEWRIGIDRLDDLVQ